MSDHKIRTVGAIRDIAPDAWDRLANPDAAGFNPFLAHAFLAALEEAGTVGGHSGWQPAHLILETGGVIAGVAPLYMKSHSQGEYVFDHGWADAFERASESYYPKLQIAVPFTPVPGTRFLVGDTSGAEEREKLLAVGAIEVARQLGVSSLHATFVTEGEWRRLGQAGFLQRTDKQFHWLNRGYRTFDDFLGNLASRKRKTVRKERAQAVASGIEIVRLSGAAITEAHWDAFFAFYMDTGGRKWGRPYLNRRFFSLLGATMADHCLLVLARRDGRWIAGALNLIGGDCLYGRYWGAIEQHPFLHFELCYYQAIEHAIGLGLPRVEAGAQGEHKLARGYEPVATHSLHWIANEGFRRAVARYLDEERRHALEEREMLAEFLPYRKAPPPEEA